MEAGTSLGQVDGCLGRGWRVLSTGGLGTRAQDMLEPLAEWFYTTEYISSVPLAFQDPRRQLSVVCSN